MRSAVRASGAILVGLMFVACTAPGGPGSAKDWNWADGGTTNVTDEICTPARGSEALPARANVMSANAIPGGGDTVYTEQLFNMFASNCGQCHVQGSIGDFHVTARNFAQVVDQSVVDVIKSDNPDVFMPPLATGALPFSQRPANDPTVALVKLLEQWIAQGRPAVVFTIASEGGDDSPYLLANDVGLGMTNIGNCVPGRAMYASAAPTMDERDTFFAQLTQLPETIRETDLKSLDAAVLARSGIIAYAPQYPLWSDNAGKIRHIRVPRGKSVRFDKQKQTFEIPPNTRFYKTFLKPVIDRDGNPTFRKLETRLIVSRPDTVAPDGTVQQNALFGTYVWNEDETQARLLNLPLNNLKPFTDSVIQYTVDEPKYQMIVDSMPANLDYEIEFGNPGLKRRYAIPGSVRCVQCHMGSPTKDFVLGFFPLQVARRPSATGGSYEPSGPDEMTQLQRLIDYGVITGVDSPNDIVPLEQPQGTRPPRNDYEIKAQAYLLGNCAHCHNPRGFPSAKNPELKDALDFLPSATGGVFQFPLERTSPLRQRGLNQNIPIPYITPSLREYPVDQQDTATWTLNKWVPDCSSTRQDEDILARLLCQGQIRPTPAFVEAPWRSLLYRNVDTPFMYTDDLTIFPHMPMHTPGFDCRAPRILGDWMVSIPAARKKPSINENWMPGALDPVSGIPLPYDDSPQPYVEVPPSDTTRYPDAVAAADRRLSAYHKSIRYGFCPDNSEIVDPAVVIAGGDLPIIPVADNVWDPKDPTKLLQPNLGIPIRPHWVVTDITDPPGDWFPRQSLWKSILVDGVVDTGDLPPDSGARAEEIRSRAAVKEALEKATITDELRRFALTEMAYGLWEKKPGCNFTAIPKVSSIPADVRPRWMKIMPPAVDASVYTQSPGAAVFKNICINCHGPKADAQGLLADAIMNMTGGTARVANFRDGLFGPVASPGLNRARVFGEHATSDVGEELLSGRYLSWMALGGTRKKIPGPLLNLVATTRILGAARNGTKVITSASPNMLRLAQELCAHVLPASRGVSSTKLGEYFFRYGTLDWAEETGLIASNADAEMWQRLCSIGNRAIVRVPYVDDWQQVGGGNWPKIDWVRSLYWADAYPADAPVLDHRGRRVMGISPDNLLPLCIRRPTDPQHLAIADQFIAANPVGGPGGDTIPYCPPQLFQDPQWLLATVVTDTGTQLIDVDRWATRGAVNAGLAVFLYLDQLERSTNPAKPEFNHCENLAP